MKEFKSKQDLFSEGLDKIGEKYGNSLESIGINLYDDIKVTWGNPPSVNFTKISDEPLFKIIQADVFYLFDCVNGDV